MVQWCESLLRALSRSCARDSILATTGSRRDRRVQVFGDFDKDGNGSLDRSELKLAFAALGVMLKESEIKAVMEEADEDGSVAVLESCRGGVCGSVLLCLSLSLSRSFFYFSPLCAWVRNPRPAPRSPDGGPAPPAHLPTCPPTHCRDGEIDAAEFENLVVAETERWKRMNTSLAATVCVLL